MFRQATSASDAFQVVAALVDRDLPLDDLHLAAFDLVGD